MDNAESLLHEVHKKYIGRGYGYNGYSIPPFCCPLQVSFMLVGTGIFHIFRTPDPAFTQCPHGQDFNENQIFLLNHC